MKTALLIAGRELRSYFRSPLGCIVAAAMLLLDGILFQAFALGSGSRLSADVLSALTERKHKLFEIESLGQVNAISCPRGLPKDSSGCAAATDPRGTGAAFSAPS